jgi:hypothetical protein
MDKVETTVDTEKQARVTVLRATLFSIFAAVQDTKQCADVVLKSLTDVEAGINVFGKSTLGSRTQSDIGHKLEEMKGMIEYALRELGKV